MTEVVHLQNCTDHSQPKPSLSLPVDTYQQRQSWTPEEDEQLNRVVARVGTSRWSDVANCMKGRSSKACSLRWRCFLAPNILRPSEEPFSEWEVAVIVLTQGLFGNKWYHISKHLPMRCNNDIKNHFNSHLRVRLPQLFQENTYLRSGVDLATLLTNVPENILERHRKVKEHEGTVSNSKERPQTVVVKGRSIASIIAAAGKSKSRFHPYMQTASEAQPSTAPADQSLLSRTADQPLLGPAIAAGARMSMVAAAAAAVAVAATRPQLSPAAGAAAAAPGTPPAWMTAGQKGIAAAQALSNAVAGSESPALGPQKPIAVATANPNPATAAAAAVIVPTSKATIEDSSSESDSDVSSTSDSISPLPGNLGAFNMALAGLGQRLLAQHKGLVPGVPGALLPQLATLKPFPVPPAVLRAKYAAAGGGGGAKGSLAASGKQQAAGLSMGSNSPGLPLSPRMLSMGQALLHPVAIGWRFGHNQLQQQLAGRQEAPLPAGNKEAAAGRDVAASDNSAGRGPAMPPNQSHAGVQEQLQQSLKHVQHLQAVKQQQTVAQQQQQQQTELLKAVREQACSASDSPLSNGNTGNISASQQSQQRWQQQQTIARAVAQGAGQLLQQLQQQQQRRHLHPAAIAQALNNMQQTGQQARQQHSQQQAMQSHSPSKQQAMQRHHHQQQEQQHASGIQSMQSNVTDNNQLAQQHSMPPRGFAMPQSQADRLATYGSELHEPPSKPLPVQPVPNDMQQQKGQPQQEQQQHGLKREQCNDSLDQDTAIEEYYAQQSRKGHLNHLVQQHKAYREASDSPKRQKQQYKQQAQQEQEQGESLQQRAVGGKSSHGFSGHGMQQQAADVKIYRRNAAAPLDSLHLLADVACVLDLHADADAAFLAAYN